MVLGQVLLRLRWSLGLSQDSCGFDLQEPVLVGDFFLSERRWPEVLDAKCLEFTSDGRENIIVTASDLLVENERGRHGAKTLYEDVCNRRVSEGLVIALDSHGARVPPESQKRGQEIYGYRKN